MQSNNEKALNAAVAKQDRVEGNEPTIHQEGESVNTSVTPLHAGDKSAFDTTIHVAGRRRAADGAEQSGEVAA